MNVNHALVSLVLIHQGNHIHFILLTRVLIIYHQMLYSSYHSSMTCLLIPWALQWMDMFIHESLTFPLTRLPVLCPVSMVWILSLLRIVFHNAQTVLIRMTSMKGITNIPLALQDPSSPVFRLHRQTSVELASCMGRKITQSLRDSRMYSLNYTSPLTASFYM